MGVGKLTVVVGPMMSEKSTTVYRYVSRALRSKRKVEVCTHVLDKRWGGGRFTHSGLSLAGLKIRPRVVANSLELWEGLGVGVQVLVIEEAQFFDMDLPLYIPKVLERGTSVVAAGLDLTSDGFPFGSMGHLMCLADMVQKLTAICPCGEEATRSLCLVEKSGSIEIGGEEKYTPACYPCWRNKGKDWSTNEN